jgi:hypothetical protein
MLIAHALASIWTTLTPGTMRSRSGMLVAPDRRISSRFRTKTAAAARDSLCSFFETEVTCTFRSCSRLASPSLFCPDETATVTTRMPSPRQVRNGWCVIIDFCLRAETGVTGLRPHMVLIGRFGGAL